MYFPIHVPPLRQRREDIPDLVHHFLRHFGRCLNKPIERVDPTALRLLTEYHWPGNVRELENLVERAVIIASGDTLHVDLHWLEPAREMNAERGLSPSRLEDIERRAILDALRICRGRIYGTNGAAAILGVKPTTLYGKMRKHRIPRQSST